MMINRNGCKKKNALHLFSFFPSHLCGQLSLPFRSLKKKKCGDTKRSDDSSRKAKEGRQKIKKGVGEMKTRKDTKNIY